MELDIKKFHTIGLTKSLKLDIDLCVLLEQDKMSLYLQKPLPINKQK